MRSTTPRVVHERVAAAIAGADGWHESPWPYDLFGLEPRTLAHQAFAVGLGVTLPARSDDPQLRRGGRALEVWSSTVVRVVWSRSMRVDNQVASYRDALDAELALVAAALTADRNLLDVRLSQVLERQVVRSDGSPPWFVGRVELRAAHTYPLEATW